MCQYPLGPMSIPSGTDTGKSSIAGTFAKWDPSVSIPSGTDTGKSSMAGTFVKWDSRMELFVPPISSYSVWLTLGYV